MPIHKIEFEKHLGTMNTSIGTVVFYNLEFENIFQAGEFLKDISPGNYKGWVKDDGTFGLIDVETNDVYTYT